MVCEAYFSDLAWRKFLTCFCETFLATKYVLHRLNKCDVKWQKRCCVTRQEIGAMKQSIYWQQNVNNFLAKRRRKILLFQEQVWLNWIAKTQCVLFFKLIFPFKFFSRPNSLSWLLGHLAQLYFCALSLVERMLTTANSRGFRGVVKHILRIIYVSLHSV